MHNKLYVSIHNLDCYEQENESYAQNEPMMRYWCNVLFRGEDGEQWLLALGAL